MSHRTFLCLYKFSVTQNIVGGFLVARSPAEKCSHLVCLHQNADDAWGTGTSVKTAQLICVFPRPGCTRGFCVLSPKAPRKHTLTHQVNQPRKKFI